MKNIIGMVLLAIFSWGGAALAADMPEPNLHLGSCGVPFFDGSAGEVRGSIAFWGGYPNKGGMSLRLRPLGTYDQGGGIVADAPEALRDAPGFTLSFWTLMHAPGTMVFWESGDKGIAVEYKNKGFELRVNGQAAFWPTADVVRSETWHLLLFNYDGKEARLLVSVDDAIQDLGAKPLSAGNVAWADSKFILGNNSDFNNRPRGLLDNVRVYVKGAPLSTEQAEALLANEMAVLMQAKSVRQMDSALPGWPERANPVTYRTVFWPPSHKRFSRDNHRAIVRITMEQAKADAVLTRLPLRRQAVFPNANNVVVRTSPANEAISEVLVMEYSNAELRLVFQPVEGVTEYAIHHAVWEAPKMTASSEWMERNGLTYGKTEDLPRAELVAMESRHDSDRFDPMEIIALPSEVDGLLEKYPDAPYLLFPESAHPLDQIHMERRIPLVWTQEGPKETLRLDASRNEFVSFQIGVWAARQGLENVRVEFEGLKGPGGTVSAERMVCFNTTGVDTYGRAFTTRQDVESGRVLPLWCGVDLPEDLKPGEYVGACKIISDNQPVRSITLALDVADAVLPDKGTVKNENLSRLSWLHSKAGLEDTVTKPYEPVMTDGDTVGILGRKFQLGEGGLPVKMVSFGNEVLARPISWTVQMADGTELTPTGGMQWTEQSDTVARWEGKVSRDGLKATLAGSMEFDGYGELVLTLEADKAAQVADTVLEIALRPEHATYMNGLGVLPGYRPETLDWSWGLPNDSFWIGSPHAGFYGRFKGERDYVVWRTYEEFEIPEGWDNSGKGHLEMRTGEDAVTVKVASGDRTIQPGEPVEFRFAFMATPVKPMSNERWNWRYVINDDSFHHPDLAANIAIIMPQGPAYYLINYPFSRQENLRILEQRAKERGIALMPYYGHGRISNHMEEAWAFRAMREEFLNTKGQAEYDPDGSFDNVKNAKVPWLMEHYVDEFVPGWANNMGNDVMEVSISPQNHPTRYDNYYLAGAKWLMEHYDIIGFYQDGHRNNRKVQQRLRRIIDAIRPDGLVNYHSGNPYQKGCGFQDAMLWFIENMPYTDSLWFGENFMYQDMPPDRWMVSVSGIPFGVPGEMLSIPRHPGNLWRGMVFGIDQRSNNRVVGKADELWKLWDDFGIQDAEMLGYWETDCPVRTGRDDILATAYVREDRVLIALASWAEETQSITLGIDWEALGFGPEGYHLRAPAFMAFQPAAEFAVDEAIRIEPVKGWILVLEEKSFISNDGEVAL